MYKHSVKRAWLVVGAVLPVIFTAHGSPRSLSALVDAVVRSGPVNELPAHLSVVLGINRIEQPTAVKQAVMRDGVVVRTFNVCSANHDVVMITYNEQSHSSKAYLTSITGELRKAVAFQAGAPAIDRSLAAARGDFAKEIQFWTNLEHRPAAPP